jgi:hypothetical protein
MPMHFALQALFLLWPAHILDAGHLEGFLLAPLDLRFEADPKEEGPPPVNSQGEPAPPRGGGTLRIATPGNPRPTKCQLVARPWASITPILFTSQRLAIRQQVQTTPKNMSNNHVSSFKAGGASNSSTPDKSDTSFVEAPVFCFLFGFETDQLNARAKTSKPTRRRGTHAPSEERRLNPTCFPNHQPGRRACCSWT